MQEYSSPFQLFIQFQAAPIPFAGSFWITQVMTGMKTYQFSDMLFNLFPGNFINHLFNFRITVDNCLPCTY